jgi:hypothetical protein
MTWPARERVAVRVDKEAQGAADGNGFVFEIKGGGELLDLELRLGVATRFNQGGET